MKKIYYYIDLEQKSPLRISSGDDMETDSDILMDSRNLPFIPGSSIAGVLRSSIDKDLSKNIFGDVDIEQSMNKEKTAILESRIQVSDAVLKMGVSEKDIVVSIRDGVGLNDWGLNEKGAKYDFQVVETKEIYHAVIEWSGDESQEECELIDILESILKEAETEGLQFGARTTRGYGAMNVRIQKKEFIFPQDVKEWLDYYPLDQRFEKNKGDSLPDNRRDIANKVKIKLAMKFKDSFNIRVKTSRLELLEDGTKPDSIPLTNRESKPVVPGTAWAGAFRHHIHHIIEEIETDSETGKKMKKEIDCELFGIDGRNGHKKSKLVFSETVVDGGYANTIMRSAVDRFTAAPKNTGLFTNQVWAGGNGELVIFVDKDIKDSKSIQYLMASIYDLDLGLFSVGGEAGIGRGLVELTGLEIDEIDCLEKLRKGMLQINKEE